MAERIDASGVIVHPRRRNFSLYQAKASWASSVVFAFAIWMAAASPAFSLQHTRA